MNEYERYELWRTMNGFRIFFGEWSMFVFYCFCFIMGIYYLYISYHFFFGYKDIPPIKIQLTTNQTWLAGNIIEQQKGASPAVPQIWFQKRFSMAGFTCWDRITYPYHPWFFEWTSYDLLFCSPKSGIDGSWWNQQIPETSRDCDFLDDRRHMSFFFFFFFWDC